MHQRLHYHLQEEMINSHQTHVMFSTHVLSFFFLLYCDCTKNVTVYVQSLQLANWNAWGNHSTVSIFKGNKKIFKRKFIKKESTNQERWWVWKYLFCFGVLKKTKSSLFLVVKSILVIWWCRFILFIPKSTVKGPT